MKKQSILLYSFLTASTLCLGAGYVVAGSWGVLLVFPILAMICLLVKKSDTFLSASLYLAVTISLAANGILSELSLPLMLISGAASLAGWELLQFKWEQDANPELVQNKELGDSHLITLGLAIGAGLALALMSSLLTLDLPFMVISILGLLVFGGLIYGFRQIEKTLS